MDYSKQRKLLYSDRFNNIKEALKGSDSDIVIEKQLLEFDNESKDHFTTQPIGIKLWESIRYIPAAGKDIKPEIIDTYKNLSIKGKEELLYFIDSLIDNLYAYIEKWEKVRTIIKQDKNTEIKRIK